MSRNRPIWQAYQDTGSLAIGCPNCGALPDQWCTRPDGRVRRVPCIERAVATAVVENPGKYGRDFTEPIHPQKDKESQ